MGVCERRNYPSDSPRYTVGVVGRVQRFPLQATWMVGPPSSWLLRDQEDAGARVVHRVDTLFDGDEQPAFIPLTSAALSWLRVKPVLDTKRDSSSVLTVVPMRECAATR